MSRTRSLVAAVAGAGALCLVALPPADAASGNLLKNPGFEKSQTSNVWKGEDCCVTTSDPHGGSWIAWMGGTGSKHTDTITQGVSIPKGPGAKVAFWLKVNTEEPFGSPDDSFKVRITNAAGKTFVVKTLTSADASGTPTNPGTYKKYTADVSRFVGKTVKVSFIAHEDQGDRTDFELDDTSLKVG